MILLFHSFVMTSIIEHSLSDIIWLMTHNKNCGFDTKHPRYQKGVKRSSDVTWSQYEQQEAKRRMQMQQQKEKQEQLEKIQQALIAKSKKLIKPKSKKKKKEKKKKEEEKKEQS